MVLNKVTIDNHIKLRVVIYITKNKVARKIDAKYYFRKYIESNFKTTPCFFQRNCQKNEEI